MSFFSFLGFNKSKPKKNNNQDLKKLMLKIMATQAEVVAQLKEVKQNLDDISLEVDKVSKETDTLQTLINDLQGQILSNPVSQELADAVKAVADQVTVVKTGVKAVDDKVPDNT